MWYNNDACKKSINRNNTSTDPTETMTSCYLLRTTSEKICLYQMENYHYKKSGCKESLEP